MYSNLSLLMTLVTLVYISHAAAADSDSDSDSGRGQREGAAAAGGGAASGVLVQLFEWPWRAVADECERVLGGSGYTAVQLSPGQECAVVPGRPWWERYQPVSYRLSSRSGSARQLQEAAGRCGRQGVRLIADVVLNHMTGGQAGSGSGGTRYNGTAEQYPGRPGYNSSHFNDAKCHTPDGNIDSYGDAGQVRNCRLQGLRDLDQSQQHVRHSMAAYLRRLLRLGVTGFRIDAAKHMWPGDLSAILSRLRVPRRWRRIGGERRVRPLVYLEVIDHGSESEAVHVRQYTGLGRVTEFRHSDHISALVRRQDRLVYTRTWGASWGMLADGQALVFVDNHDSQRSGGGSVVTHTEPRLYRLAQALVLARPYALPRVMSSYRFASADQGPPADPASGQIVAPRTDPASGQCEAGAGWVCEHRWPQIAGMAGWRRAAGPAPLVNWWSNGDQQIAYARQGRAFIAVNNQPDAALARTLNTSLPAGRYCDVISGRRDSAGSRCSGRTVLVDTQALVQVEIAADAEDAVLAIHVQQRLSYPTHARLGPDILVV